MDLYCLHALAGKTVVAGVLDLNDPAVEEHRWWWSASARRWTDAHYIVHWADGGGSLDGRSEFGQF